MSRWDRLEQHFNAVLDSPADERDAYLAALRENEPELYQEVVELLRAEADVTTGAGAAVVASTARFLSTLDNALVGQRIGAYQVLTVIGTGGMGTVYRAERADGSFDRQVALKVVKRGMDTADGAPALRAGTADPRPASAPQHRGAPGCGGNGRWPAVFCDGAHQR